MNSPLLQLRNLTKRFGPKVANDQVSLDVYPGMVHAIVGENGAGKTTLMSMINGTATPDEGEILFDGDPVRIATPQQADALGIGMVFQHFKVVGSLTVAANVFLGRELTNGVQLDAHRMEERVAELSKQFGLEVDPRALARDLSVGQLQRVEVLKALSHETRLLILDEPTAVLTPQETDDMFLVIRDLAAKGVAVVFISHKLDEVLAISDLVTVIRDGRVIGTVQTEGLSKEDIAKMMVGRDVLLRIEHTEASPGETVLNVDDLTVIDSRGVTALHHLSLEVKRGEIVGIAGVEGNGQSELTAAIAGLHDIAGGSVTLNGVNVTRASVAARRSAGLAYIPEDRHHVGTAPTLSVAENVAATRLYPPVAHRGWLSSRAMAHLGQTMIEKYDVRGAHPDTPVGSLSGGNMQKVVIAREFESDPSLLVVSQPTRGVDVGAMEFVHNSLVEARDRGAGVLLISADLNEVMSLSDRLLVLYDGRIIANFTQATMNETAVGLAMLGEVPNAEAVAVAEAEHADTLRTLAAEASHTPDQDLPPLESVDSAAERAPLPTAPDSEESAQARRSVSKDTSNPFARVFSSWLQPLLAILLALLVGAIVMLAIGKNPLVAYGALFFSAPSTPAGIGNLIAQGIPLLILSSAVIVSFRAGFFNIGGEGQMFLGALGAAAAGVAVGGSGLPGPLQALIVLAAAFASGAVWGAIPGALIAAWRVDMVVTTLMLNSIAVLFTAFMVTGPLKDPNVGIVATPRVDRAAMLPMWVPAYSIGADLVIAILVALAVGLLLTRSAWGLKVRELGELNRFAEYTGVSAAKMSVQVMLLAGGVSGIAGGLFVLGPNSGGRFLQTFSPGWGFAGLTVALLARLNPWAGMLAAVFYADLMAGANGMQSIAQVPYPMYQVIQGLIIITITGTFILNWRRRKVATTSAVEPDGDQDTAEVRLFTTATPVDRSDPHAAESVPDQARIEGERP